MKMLQIVPRDGTRLYGAMIRKQAEIRRGGRGTFSRAAARKRNAATVDACPLQGVDRA